MDSDLEYCRLSFERSDYPHYLISLLMPGDKRPALWVLGAFKNVIETIPGSVSDPALGYMRLTWWRDQIGILEQGGLTKGQPILSALSVIASEAQQSVLLKDFINEYEAVVENPGTDFVSVSYQKLLQSVLGDEYAKYQRLQNALTEMMKKHHGTKWESRPPFMALRLWFASF